MTQNGTLQIVLYLVIVLALVKPLGWYIAQIYQGKLNIPVISHLERFIYRLSGIKPTQEMNWTSYLVAMLFFNLLGVIVVYFIQRSQAYLPLNPQGFPNVTPQLAFNTAISFVTNTNWQAYAGETTLSYLTQMFALTVQNFLSAATGMCLLVAFIRGLIRHESKNLGNYWVDLVRGTLYLFIPLAFVFSIFLASQGVIQNFNPNVTANLVQKINYQEPATDASHKAQVKVIDTQVIPMGPVASQVSIKQLGTNGGGYFNANSAHPFENPNPLTNFMEMLAILLIPAALCYTFGLMVGETRQGWMLLIAMLIIFVPLLFASVATEQMGNPKLTAMGISQTPIVSTYAGGNMEGKETRFGIVNSAMWASATTATGNGSVNAMHDSFMPLGGLIPMWFIQLGEPIFGGVGSGLSGMLIYVILTVFVAGLMVGRTPEYLGKKIEPYEMKMASFTVLLMPLVVLMMTAVAVVTPAGTSAIGNPGAHGFSEILYAFSSMANNNGSAFAGLNANTFFYNVLGGFAMLVGRYWIAIPTLAIAGSLASKKYIPSSLGTLPTNTFLFVVMLISIVLVIGALTFLPALALGPIVEHLMLWGHYGS